MQYIDAIDARWPDGLVRVAFVSALFLSTATAVVASDILALGDVFPAHDSLGNMLVQLLIVKRGWMHPHILIIFGSTFLVGSGVALISQSRRAKLTRAMRWIAVPLSVVSSALLVLPGKSTSPLGRVMAADLILIVALQLVLYATGRISFWNVVIGPLGSIANTAPDAGELNVTTTTSLRAILLIGALVPALYRERDERLTVPDLVFNFNPLEAYATLQITASVVIFVASYVPRIDFDVSIVEVCRRLGALLIIVALANHNIAATWALTI